MVGWAAHNSFPGHNEQTWLVKGANFTVCALGRVGEKLAAVFTAGEAYHNNHHAFPDSARLANQRVSSISAGSLCA